MSPRGGRRGRFIPRTDGAAAHQDWLSLCAPTLPFLSVPVLTDAFETGPLHIDRDLRAAAISRWEGGDLDDGAVDDRDRTTWVEWLLTDLLGFDDRVAKTDRFTTAGTEPGTSVTATYAILDDPTQPPLLQANIGMRYGLDDVRAVKDSEAKGLEGLIIGKALYAGKVDLAEAMQVAHA